jgi:hypothetical protein
MGPMLVGEDVVYKQMLTDPGMFASIYGGASVAMQSIHRRCMKQGEMLRIIACVGALDNDRITSNWTLRLRRRFASGIDGGQDHRLSLLQRSLDG